jgi:NAD(P)-dependent dehydrogenase (short-subunit alcohol dehydrogenase family)
VFDLSGHVGLITGGNSGIGLGMAKGLAEAGASVVIWGTNPDKNERAAGEIATFGGEVRSMLCDVGDEQAVESSMAAMIEEFGRVDSCFCNAGISNERKSITKTSLEEWHKVLRVNLDGTFLTARAAARNMIEHGHGGSIVMTSSTATIMGQAGGTPYAASKGAQVAVAKALAVELARYGIRVNTLVPGWIESELTKPAFAWDKFADAVMPRIPQRRWGLPADFAGIAVYLASDASTYHTGDTILIDGAYTLF